MTSLERAFVTHHVGANLLTGLSRLLTPLLLSRKGRGETETVDSPFTLYPLSLPPPASPNFLDFLCH